MWFNWIPWKFVVRSVARARGFIDPIAVLGRLHSFAQPAEVTEPIELLRAGVVFHARGLINGVIQHNLDWVWPYWVERQFDPSDDAFIPRAFSATHVNLTHRNWTAVGVPGGDELPIVDPRGLVMPFWDSWSVDCWVFNESGLWLLPSRAPSVVQTLEVSPTGLVVVTSAATGPLKMESRVRMENDGGRPVLFQSVTFGCSALPGPDVPSRAWGVISLRPYNPEGVSFVHEVRTSPDGRMWTIDGNRKILFDQAMDRCRSSGYRQGDVRIHLLDPSVPDVQRCPVGLQTSAALFRLEPGEDRRVELSIPLSDPATSKPKFYQVDDTWEGALRHATPLAIGDPLMQRLYDTAIRTLIIHSPGDVYPGPYTYRRFWFRDAAFMVHALLCIGLVDRAQRAISRFPERQTRDGYFLSQEGEWDSNGQVLWLLERARLLTGWVPGPEWHEPIRKAARWIEAKCVSGDDSLPHAGLLPAGFSAEHLGPCDFYYWDDFWAVAGLEAASSLLAASDPPCARRCNDAAAALDQAVRRSLTRGSAANCDGLPASPYRRMDAGAIGSLAAGYPLQLWPARDRRLLATAEFLLDHCSHAGMFFQDMVHSGINPYLTLHLAQVFLRAGDQRALPHF